MKTSQVILACSLASLAFAGAAFANDQAAAAPVATNAAPVNVAADRLWIAVHLPAETKPAWVGEDMATRFADRVAIELHAQGYQGKIGVLRPQDAAPSQASVLLVRLDSWTAKDGVADCTVFASLRTGEGDRDLGLFVGDNMVVTADGKHYISSDGLVGSAQEALNDLYSRLQATGLLKTD